MMTSNKQKSVPSAGTLADNNLYLRPCTSCLYGGGSVRERTSTHFPWNLILYKSVRKEWEICLSFYSLAGNLEILPFFIPLKMAEIRLLDLRKKIHLLPLVWKEKNHMYMNLVECFFFFFLKTKDWNKNHKEGKKLSGISSCRCYPPPPTEKY